MKKRCKWCETEFETESDRKSLCSKRCVSKYLYFKCSKSEALKRFGAEEVGPGLFRKTCQWCGEKFETKNIRQTLCSSKCASQFNHHHCSKQDHLNGNQTTEIRHGVYRKTCQWCGKTFETENIQKKNCCSLCGKYLAKHGGKSKSEWQREVADRKRAEAEIRKKKAFKEEERRRAKEKERLEKIERIERAREERRLAREKTAHEKELRKAEREARKAEARKIRESTTYERTCKYCGKSFTTNKIEKLFCSKRCYYMWRHYRMPKSEALSRHCAEEVSPGVYRKICDWCGKAFETKNITLSVCSSVCCSHRDKLHCSKSEFLKKLNAVEVRPGIYRKTCQWCGKEFETSNLQQRNCCSQCGKYLSRSGGKSKEEWKKEVAERQQLNRTKVRKCRYCGKEFVAENDIQGTRIYCSDGCATSYKKFGCSKTEHEKRMSERVIALRSWSPYLGGTVTKLTAKATCAWCGNEFDSFRGARCCCAEHSSRWFYYGRMSEAEVRQSRKKICPWCLNVFDATSTKHICCCERHAWNYGRYRMSIEEHESNLLYGEHKCIVCGSSFMRNGTKSRVCPGCRKTGVLAIFNRTPIYKSGDPFEDEQRILNAVALKRVMLAEYNRRRQEYIVLFKGFNRCRNCGKLFEVKQSFRILCDECREASRKLSIERKRERARLYRIAHYEEERERSRRYYAANRERISDYGKWYRNEFRYKVYAREHGLTEEQAKEHFDAKEREIARLDALSAEEEIRIAETRKKFHHVEMVMLMPEGERWQFSKDWTDEERAYAAEISSAGSVGGFFDDGDNDEILISDLDDGCI